MRDAAQLVAADCPKILQIVMHRNVNGRDMADALIAGVRKNPLPESSRRGFAPFRPQSAAREIAPWRCDMADTHSRDRISLQFRWQNLHDSKRYLRKDYLEHLPRPAESRRRSQARPGVPALELSFCSARSLTSRRLRLPCHAPVSLSLNVPAFPVYAS